MEKYVFLAMFTQVLLTFFVMLIMGHRRFSAAKNKLISMDDFKTMRLNAGDQVRVADRNYINQFEIPMLYFVACLAAIHINAASYLFTALAWGFVCSRIVHTFIHIGTNQLKPRYYSFLLGCLLVLLMWIVIMLHLFAL